MKGQINSNEIPSSIISGLVVIIFLLAALSILNSLASKIQNIGCEKYINEINNLKAQLDEKDSEILKLKSLLFSLNKSLDEKDRLIANLTAELNKTRKENEILKKEINYYEEKKYITEIHNYLFNISNQLTEIKNEFLVIGLSIGLSIGLFSLTLIEIVFKPFRHFYRKRKLKKSEKPRKGDSS